MRDPAKALRVTAIAETDHTSRNWPRWDRRGSHRTAQSMTRMRRSVATRNALLGATSTPPPTTRARDCAGPLLPASRASSTHDAAPSVGPVRDTIQGDPTRIAAPATARIRRSTKPTEKSIATVATKPVAATASVSQNTSAPARNNAMAVYVEKRTPPGLATRSASGGRVRISHRTSAELRRPAGPAQPLYASRHGRLRRSQAIRCVARWVRGRCPSAGSVRPPPAPRWSRASGRRSGCAQP